MPSLFTRLDDLLGSRVPVEPTLVVPLAHELAHIEVDSAMGKQVDPQLTVFEYSQHGEFPGLVIAGSAEKKRSGSPVLTRGILNSAGTSAIGRTVDFIAQLSPVSRQIPNLTRARFGIGFIEEGRPVHELPLCGTSSQSVSQSAPLQLRGRHLIGASTGELRLIVGG